MSWFSRKPKEKCFNCGRSVPVEDGFLIPHAHHNTGFIRSFSWRCEGSNVPVAEHIERRKSKEDEMKRLWDLY